MEVEVKIMQFNVRPHDDFALVGSEMQGCQAFGES